MDLTAAIKYLVSPKADGSNRSGSFRSTPSNRLNLPPDRAQLAEKGTYSYCTFSILNSTLGLFFSFLFFSFLFFSFLFFSPPSILPTKKKDRNKVRKYESLKCSEITNQTILKGSFLSLQSVLLHYCEYFLQSIQDQGRES